MGSRSTRVGADSAYRAAEAWVNRGLRSDDSLFTPGTAIWSQELLGELHSRFLDRPDESKRQFLEKLQDQSTLNTMKSTLMFPWWNTWWSPQRKLYAGA